jgi:hypothetical protein
MSKRNRRGSVGLEPTILMMLKKDSVVGVDYIKGAPQLSQNFALLLIRDPQFGHFFLLSPNSPLISSI